MPTEDKGLTSSQAKTFLEKHGPNVLPERPPPSNLVILISQLKSPLVYILFVAGVVTFFLKDFSDTIIITFAVLLNTVLGFFQERRAGRALYALKRLIHPTATVIRDGEHQKLEVTQIVPGDLVILNQGDKISADGILIEANRFFVTEAILTGEAAPVAKKQGDKAFMGTVVSAGQAKMLVKLTGAQTEIGKIALQVQEPEKDTPLRRQIKGLSKQLSFLVLGLTVFVFIVGCLVGKGLLEIFTTAVALAVSAIPEGLLVGLTVVLAIGMQRILKRKGLVRNLVSAETLGGVTTICVDKTGTLTQGKMQVVNIFGESEKLAHQSIIANDLDDPLVIAAYDWAQESFAGDKKKISELIKTYPRLDSIPFSSQDRFFASLNKGDKGNAIFVNGAPEFLVNWCSLEKSEQEGIKDQVEKLTAEGKRVVGMARKNVASSVTKLENGDVKAGLEWVGLLAFSDPVRSGVKVALAKTKLAGIDLLVITGDYPQTAISVMRQLDIEVKEDQLILGEELEKMNEETLAKELAKDGRVRLFARTTPDQKLKIVEALKRNNEVVAMMGDGVNDAPAINKADIGIVVGEASDVAKESADLVLLDSNFATIVAAIEEGRGIFDNIRKIILYLMSDAFEEIIAVVGTLILGLPLPVTAAQILWINLVSDGFPDLALTIDPKLPGIMKRPPRPVKEKLVSVWMRNLIVLVSFFGGVVAFGLFVWFYQHSQNIILARSIAFATLGVNSLVYVFSTRTLTEPFWKESLFGNKWLNLAVLFGFSFQLAPFAFGPIRKFLNLSYLAPIHWCLVALASLTMFIMIEISKIVFRHKLK
jgi:Ca2+-transporting ATPase